MMYQQEKNPYVGHGHGYYQNPGQQPNIFWQPGASQTPGSFFPGYNQQPKLPFLATLHLPNLISLLNDPIYHDPHCPLIPTKFPRKFALLASVLVIIMAVTSVRIQRLLRRHRMTPIVGRKGLGLLHIPSILGRVSSGQHP